MWGGTGWNAWVVEGATSFALRRRLPGRRRGLVRDRRNSMKVPTRLAETFGVVGVVVMLGGAVPVGTIRHDRTV